MLIVSTIVFNKYRNAQIRDMMSLSIVLKLIILLLYSPIADADGVIAKYFLKSIMVYPIKSCAGFNAESWPLSGTGII